MKLYNLKFKNNAWNNPLPTINSSNSLIILFGPANIDCDFEGLKQLKEKYASTPIIGCSSAGEIYQDLVIDDSLVIVIIEFAHSKFKIVTSKVKTAEDSKTAGAKLANSLADLKSLKGVFVLSNGLNVNGSELSTGLNSQLADKNIVITGGLAGDGDRFEKTWVMHNYKIEENTIVAVGFYGDKLHFGHGSQGGWDNFGPERMITKSEGNILYELDGRPALDLYKEYLGDKAKDLPSSALLFPLQIRKSEQDAKKLVRTILSVDHGQNTMTFAGDVPQGHLSQLMMANFDRLVDGASEAAQLATFETEQPVLALAISCVGRRLVLGERIDEEVEATLSKLPKNTKQIGFYSYGEISPYMKNAGCELHNQTMTLTTIWEE